jgi:hypothetical protein
MRDDAATRSVTLDGRPLPPLQAGAKGQGWHKSANGISIQIMDDSQMHQIEVK